MIINWNCDVCHKKRNDDKISVYSRDISAQFGLPPGSGRENVKYCNDDSKCIEGARVFSRFKKVEEAIQNEK